MIAQEALELIEHFEGYLRRLNDGTDRVKPYLCPARVWTIGVGTTRYPNGVRVKGDDPPIDKATAYRYLESELREDTAGVNKYTAGVKWHPLSHGATVSFAYNCGVGAFRRSGFRKAVLDERWEDVPRELAKWRMGGGRVLRGLVRRRAAEAKLFMEGVARLKAGEPPYSTLPVQPKPQPPQTPTKPIPVPQRSWWSVLFGWIFQR